MAFKEKPTINCNLPDKYSELLRLAVADLEKCENNPKYAIDMGVWHQGEAQGTCFVCLGGSVLAQTCKLPPEEYAEPDDSFIPQHVTQKLYALNDLRQGSIQVAYERRLGGTRPMGLPYSINVPRYRSNDSAEFKAAMLDLADLLEKHGD